MRQLGNYRWCRSQQCGMPATHCRRSSRLEGPRWKKIRLRSQRWHKKIMLSSEAGSFAITLTWFFWMRRSHTRSSSRSSAEISWCMGWSPTTRRQRSGLGQTLSLRRQGSLEPQRISLLCPRQMNLIRSRMFTLFWIGSMLCSWHLSTWTSVGTRELQVHFDTCRSWSSSGSIALVFPMSWLRTLSSGRRSIDFNLNRGRHTAPSKKRCWRSSTTTSTCGTMLAPRRFWPRWSAKNMIQLENQIKFNNQNLQPSLPTRTRGSELETKGSWRKPSSSRSHRRRSRSLSRSNVTRGSRRQSGSRSHRQLLQFLERSDATSTTARWDALWEISAGSNTTAWSAALATLWSAITDRLLCHHRRVQLLRQVNWGLTRWVFLSSFLGDRRTHRYHRLSSKFLRVRQVCHKQYQPDPFRFFLRSKLRSMNSFFNLSIC